MSPDERRRRKEEVALWARQRREFEQTYQRLKAQWRDDDARRERRRQVFRLPWRLLRRSA